MRPSLTTVHVDGAFGGITPNGHIDINLYSERNPIPTLVFHPLTDGKLGDEIRSERVTRDGVVRELEVGAVMDVRAARGLRDWLTSQIEELEKTLRSFPETR